MNSKRVFYAMIACLALLFAATLGTAYLANGMLMSKSKTLNDLKLKNEVLEKEKVILVQAKKDIATYQPLEKIAKTIVPQDKDQARAIREIVKIAKESNINLSSITFPVSTLGDKKGAAAVPGTPAMPTGSAAAGLSQLKAVKDIKGVYVLNITLTQDASDPVSYSEFITFLSRLEQNRRTAQVSNIVLQPDPVDRTKLAFTLTIDEFIKP